MVSKAAGFAAQAPLLQGQHRQANVVSSFPAFTPIGDAMGNMPGRHMVGS